MINVTHPKRPTRSFACAQCDKCECIFKAFDYAKAHPGSRVYRADGALLRMSEDDVKAARRAAKAKRLAARAAA